MHVQALASVLHHYCPCTCKWTKCCVLILMASTILNGQHVRFILNPCFRIQTQIDSIITTAAPTLAAAVTATRPLVSLAALMLFLPLLGLAFMLALVLVLVSSKCIHIIACLAKDRLRGCQLHKQNRQSCWCMTS